MALTRIALIGPMGIGKTTAIRALCGNCIVDCDVTNLDTAQHSKATTTVGADLGEVDLGGGDRLQVYGCPGQDRFEFVRSYVLSLALGAFIMVDVRHPEAVNDAARLVREIEAQPTRPLALVLSSRPSSDDDISKFSDGLFQAGCGLVPVLQADPRNQAEMLEVLQVLVSMLSVSEESA